MTMGSEDDQISIKLFCNANDLMARVAFCEDSFNFLGQKILLVL